jgi:hypothetical protein
VDFEDTLKVEVDVDVGPCGRVSDYHLEGYIGSVKRVWRYHLAPLAGDSVPGSMGVSE